MTATATRLDAKEKRLTAQFAAMEKALGAAQRSSRGSTGQIARCPRTAAADPLNLGAVRADQTG